MLRTEHQPLLRGSSSPCKVSRAILASAAGSCREFVVLAVMYRCELCGYFVLDFK